MSTLTTTTNDALIPATAEAKPARKPFWRAVFDSIAASASAAPSGRSPPTSSATAVS